MARENYKRLIEFRLNAINERLGTNYQTDYVSHYGGWNLYVVDKDNGGHFRSTLGFDTRKSSSEMLAYLSGIYNLLLGYKVERAES